jgi:Caspase domain
MSRHAFLIGHNGPRDSQLDTLSYVEQDVRQMKEVLGKAPASYDTVQVATPGSSPAETVRQFEALSSICGYDDTLLLYFSGHGHYQRGQLYLIWEETDFAKLISTSLPILLVKSVFTNSKARVRIMILDCCHSGAAGEAQFSKGTRVPFGNPIFEAARDSASLILTACGRNSTTREVAEFQSGYLTYLLRRALSDRFREADLDRDGLLSIQDFMEWCSTETTTFNEKRARNEGIDPPELYGDFRSAVYLTAQRMSYSNEFNDTLNQKVHKAVERLRIAYRNNKHLTPEQLENYARPIRVAAPGFTDLTILEELFKTADSAAIFAAAAILHVRRDPAYMAKLVAHIDKETLRGSANWRVLRALRDTLPSYQLSEQGRRDLVERLRRAAVQRHTKRGPIFDRGNTLDMIRQVCRKLKIPYEEVFSEIQLEALRGKS